MTDNKPVFICEINPRGNGGWDVWIKGEPYSISTNGRFVGSYLNKEAAQKAAVWAMQDAEQRAINLARESFTMRSKE